MLRVLRRDPSEQREKPSHRGVTTEASARSTRAGTTLQSCPLIEASNRVLHPYISQSLDVRAPQRAITLGEVLASCPGDSG